jgi:hypothetical protein
MKQFLKASVALFVLSAMPALAWNKVTTGQILSMQVGGDGSVSFTMVGLPAICTSGANQRGVVAVGAWTDGTMTADGVKLIHSTLMSAFLAGKSVVVYASLPTSTNPNTVGWGCRVGVVDIL